MKNLETIVRADFGNKTNIKGAPAISTQEEWFQEIEDSNWYSPIRIESTKKEYLESLLAKLPKYVKAKIVPCSTQFFEETETEKRYYHPEWFQLSVYFSNDSKVTKGANETAVKRANKMFKLVEEFGISSAKEDSVYLYYEKNLELIERVSRYQKD